MGKYLFLLYKNFPCCDVQRIPVFRFIETELPQGVIPANAGIHNMKFTLKCLDPLSSQGSGDRFVSQAKTPHDFYFRRYFCAFCNKSRTSSSGKPRLIAFCQCSIASMY